MTLDELAEEYLVTASGRTPQDPCGLWCGDQNVTEWSAVLIRVRRVVMLTIKRNQGVKWPDELVGASALWMMRANRVKLGGGIFHVFGAGSDEVYALINLAREGVDLLAKLQSVAVSQGGEEVGPGPLPDDRVVDEPLWLLGGVLLAVIIYSYARSK